MAAMEPSVDDKTLKAMDDSEDHVEPITLTPYEKLTKLVIHDAKFVHEVALEKRVGFYKFCGDIGRGNFSRVKSGIHLLTKDKVAIKIVDRSRLDARNLRMLSREVATLESVQHPHILRLFEVVETLGRVHLVTEFVRGGELYYRIVHNGVFPEYKAVPIFKQILWAVQYMHNQGYVHRDIKAENILVISDEHVKLADFGFSTQISNNQYLNTFCGSPPYASPELFSDNHYQGAPVDIWALGVLIYFILVGNMPFQSPTIPQLRSAVLKGDYRIPGHFSAACIKMIQCILINSPTNRPKVNQILEAEWVMYAQKPKKFSETSFEEVRSIIKHRKSFWCGGANRSASFRSERSNNNEPKKPIECSTKKFDKVPENFTNPICKYSIPKQTTVIPISNNISKISRNNSLVNSSKVVNIRRPSSSSKKKIGPMAENGKIIQVQSINKLSERSYSHDTEEIPEEEDEHVFEKYMMLPTDTQSKDEAWKNLQPLEVATREILKSYGISCVQLENSIKNGPRSDIIGIYRIVITRLKSQSMVDSASPPAVFNYNENYNFNNSNHKTFQKPKKSTLCVIL